MSHGVWLVVCLVTGVKQTNKQTNKQPDSVAFRSCEFRRTFQSQFRNAQILPE